MKHYEKVINGKRIMMGTFGKQRKSNYSFFCFILIGFIFFNGPEESAAQRKTWEVSYSHGITFHLDGRVYAHPFRELSRFTLNYFDLSADYIFGPKSRAGISLGVNSFTVPASFIQDVSFYPDTTYSYTSASEYIDAIWLSFRYLYYFNENISAGLKLGLLSNLGVKNLLYGAFIGYEFPISGMLQGKTQLMYQCADKNFRLSGIKGNQLTLTAGIAVLF